MRKITILAGEEVEKTVVEVIGTVLERVFNLSQVKYGTFQELEERYIWNRGQYDSAGILGDLLRATSLDSGRVLGVTRLDLCTPILTFVFGLAQLGGPAALVSLARLKQEYYELEPDHAVLLERACKESVHEIGHTFGLTHCSDKGCAMSLSTGIIQVDQKSIGLCASCRDHALGLEMPLVWSADDIEWRK